VQKNETQKKWNLRFLSIVWLVLLHIILIYVFGFFFYYTDKAVSKI